MAKTKRQYQRAHSWLHGHRGEWIASWSVLAAGSLAAMITFSVAHQAQPQRTGVWPVFVLGLTSAAALYGVFAPIVHRWPFERPRDPGEVAGQLASGLFKLSLAMSTWESVERMRREGMPNMEAVCKEKWEEVGRLTAELNELVRTLLGNVDAWLMWTYEPYPPVSEWVGENDKVWRNALLAINWTRTRIHDLQADV